MGAFQDCFVLSHQPLFSNLLVTSLHMECSLSECIFSVCISGTSIGATHWDGQTCSTCLPPPSTSRSSTIGEDGAKTHGFSSLAPTPPNSWSALDRCSQVWLL